jgi:hypothetical protein
MTIEQTEALIIQWQELKAIEQSAQANRKLIDLIKINIEQQIAKLNEDNIKSQLDKDYGTGSATINGLTAKVTLNYPKKVTWDNDLLVDLWGKIEASGQDASEYIDRKLSVSETRYKNMPSIYRGEFEQARTVNVGNPTITIKELK